MAKRKASLEDLDDEIARLEAELEALEKGAPVPARPAKKRPETKAEPAEPEQAEEPAGERTMLAFGRRKREAEPEAEPEPAAADAAEEPPKKRLLGRFGRKSAPAEAEAEPEAPPEEEPAASKAEKRRMLGALPFGKKDDASDEGGKADAPAPTTSTNGPVAPPPLPDGVEWRREGDAWVRHRGNVEPAETVRRVVDADGNVVEEAPATDEDLAAVQDEDRKEKVGRKLLGMLGRRGR